MIRDLTDAEARRAMPCKWGQVDADVIPAWVAEMDYALAPPIAEALADAVAHNVVGYPDFSPGGGLLGEAYAGFAQRHFGQHVDPTWVVPTVDVTAGVRVAINALSADAPVVMTLPGYPPVMNIVEACGRKRLDLVLDADAERAEIDLDQLDHLLDPARGGARTLILTNPHNPWGRVFTRAELEGIRDVVTRHGARVVADEIHAPLVLPGTDPATAPVHTPYLTLDGAADHAVAVVSASKAFNTPGLRCAQIVAGDDATRDRLRSLAAGVNESWSVLGSIAATAAYTDGDEWLAALRTRLGEQRDLLADLLARHLPEARMRPLEATYLAWLDLRAYGEDDPAAAVLERGRVRLASGEMYQPGLTGHVRLNIATSPQRLTAIVERMAAALAS
ncbi:aminotransferase class I/II-fold pyridoxal phosphate-dependent enzyme [Nocardioides sp. GY 10113]|uniref:MalY/PatB family protein n=1 Tax=Nocardioides sp. GY 10113 TaxID=2569761 RepID=UPI0010A75913|nr:aminotransferase class I/II-fold pyridoxal phosphate-dependent enzyme [Nocardioides sp. GY 10113]TIC82255.1 aminotransferase class I/II-fold pyridoxal phosphate-dependent enzyme [Nocardioides sp. GY 10113]